MKLLFSVIVPMLNEERVIARCLRALEAQTFPRDRWEVIVVDNGSRDRTLEIAASFAGSLNLTILVKTGVSISAVRNFGARAAQGECLAFLDADCVAPPDWLKLAHGALSANSRRIVGAQYTIPRDSSWVAKAWYGDLCQLKQGPILYVPGGDLIVRRDRFFELSGFDEQIETSEDCDFCQRAAASGTPAVGIAALSVEHLGTPQTLSEFFRKQRWHGSHVFQVFLKDERHIRNARSVLLAFYTLSSLAALPAGCLAAMISGHPVIALFAVAVPAILPCMLAARAAIVRGWPAIVAPLALLYLIYGTARALCLIDRRKICAIKARDVSSVTSPSAYSTSRSSE